MRNNQTYLLNLLAALVAVLLLSPRAVEAQKMFASVHGYISVETFEIRKEFVIRLDVIADDLGVDLLQHGGMISSARRAEIEEHVGKWLSGKCPLQVDGVEVAMVLDRVHFVRPDPVKGMVVEERNEVMASEVILGVVFAAALDGPVKEVKVQWQVFPNEGSAAIVAIGSRQNTVTKKVTAAENDLRWLSKGELKVPELLLLPPAPSVDHFSVPILSALAGLVVLILMVNAVRLGNKTPAWVGVTMVVMIAVAILARDRMEVNFFRRAVPITPELADEVVYVLLKNTYRAFDYRRESDVYDVLAKSVDGELLTKVYLEVQKSLELESQGGARAKVYELDLRECELGEKGAGKAPSFNAKCSWVAIGTVTHWGHTHDRVNRYEAQLSVGIVDGGWKLTALELLNQERKENKLSQSR